MGDVIEETTISENNLFSFFSSILHLRKIKNESK